MNPKRSYTWTRLEREHGRPMRDILLDAHMQHGDFPDMARVLGLSVQTLSDYWARLGLPEFGKQDDGSVTIVICGEVS